MEHSADISWRQPAQPVAEAALVAAAEAPDGRSGALAAVAAVGLAEVAAAQLFGALVAALASPPVELDAAGVVAVVTQPGVEARPARRPAERVLEALQLVWVAVAAGLRSAFALPGPPALLQGSEPNRRLSADPPAVPAHWFPALSEHPRLLGDSGRQPAEASSRDEASFRDEVSSRDFEEQVSHWGWARLERVPSPPEAPEAPLCCPGLAMHWSSARPGPEAAHWGIRSPATARSAHLSALTARRECPASLRD